MNGLFTKKNSFCQSILMMIHQKMVFSDFSKSFSSTEFLPVATRMCPDTRSIRSNWPQFQSQRKLLSHNRTSQVSMISKKKYFFKTQKVIKHNCNNKYNSTVKVLFWYFWSFFMMVFLNRGLLYFWCSLYTRSRLESVSNDQKIEVGQFTQQ